MKKSGNNISRFVLFCIALLVLVSPAMAAGTTQVHVVKYANDGKTVLNEATIDFAWMKANLPVYGDGVTHYYMQGPVFNASITDKWNPEENDPAILTKDFGAAQGTNIKDLCDLVGGMSSDDYNVTLLASDGFSKAFAYSSIYNPPDRAGPIVLTWYRADQGYVNGSFNTGMRNVMFADTTTNPWAAHVFGLWDMHETYPEAFWYYYQPGQPSATGLSVQNVDRLFIFSNQAPPVPPSAAFVSDIQSGTAPLSVQFTDQSTGTGPLTYAWDFDNNGITDNTTQSPEYTYATAGTYTVNLTVSTSVGSDSEVKIGYITVNPAPIDEWSITLTGVGSEQLTRVNFEVLADGNRLTYSDASGTWSGVALWRILARVDDADPATFNDAVAALGYNVNVSAPDLASITSSQILARNNTWIVADTLNGTPLPKQIGGKNIWPLKIVGTGLSGKQKVGNITQIVLSDFVTPPAAPVAGFTANPLSGTAPLEIQFTDQSTGASPLVYAWDFNNDGTIDSTLQNPKITLTDEGTYNVNLTVTNAVGSDSELKTNYITINPEPVIDEWSITLTGVGSEQLTRVNFEDLAEGNRLTYSDASGTWSGVALWRILARVDDTDPVTFNDAVAALGYNVNVSAPNFASITSSQILARNNTWIVADTLNGTPLPKIIGGKSVWPLKIVGTGLLGNQKVGNITQIVLSDFVSPPAAPIAGFIADPLSGTAPLEVQFTDQSTGTGPLSYAWDFNNDGTVDSTLQNPKITLTDEGTYNVNLTVTNTVGSDEIVKNDYITVTAAPAAPTAAFISDIQSGNIPLTVKFTDQSTGTGPLTYAWDFENDGVTDNTTQNPLYTYATAGTYTVNLTVTNSVGSDSEVKTGFISGSSAPGVDTLFDGAVTLSSGETFTKNAYNNVTNVYTINRTTPLGALDKVATIEGLTYNVTDKSWSNDQVLLLDDFGQYLRKKPGYWYAYVNGVYKDGYGNHANGLNVIELSNNDQVNFYYSTGTNLTAPTDATAAVKIKVNIQEPDPVVDTLFDGAVTLTPGETFTKNAYNNVTNVYTINRTTPLGALDKVATLQGFTYNVTDKRWQYDQILLLDDLGQYLYKKPGNWYAYVNGVYKDGYGNHANGLNVIELANNDQVNFYYAPNNDPANATAVVKIKVNIGDQPTVPDWTLSLTGAKTTSVTKTYFEQGLACPTSGHQTFWTDADNNTWGGVPLWVLVAMVDDNPDFGPDHFNFNDSIAEQGYSVKVVSGDGWDTTLASRDIARNNSYIVANTLNGQPLSYLTPGGKLSWPLHLKGAAVFGGQQVGNITKIELTGLPQPPTEWKLTLEGDVTDTITQSFFIDAIACKHNVTWTDPATGTVWQGVPLWDLAGAVDDVESSNHYTYNDTRATAGYTIRVSATDGFNATFASADTSHNNGYIVAYKMNGTALTGSNAPLKLVGPATTSNKQRVGGIVKISLEGLPDQYPQGNWQLKMVGKISDVIPQGEFEYSADCHSATYTDINGNVYTGIPLWRLTGWVDDRIPHGPDGFNDAAAIAGYKVIVKAGDGYAKEFTSQQIGKTNAFILANTMNGSPLPTDGSHPPYPLRLVGTGATGGNSVGNVVEIQLTDFQTPVEVPKLHIIKYGSDGITVINETYVDYIYMESNLPVIGDGTTAYKFEGLTMDPANLWDPEETYPGGFKVSNVVKGSRVHDLAELVGGMGSGTTITFVAIDGFETTLPYSSIYTNPAVQARQGDAIIAWWGDGQYVPNYADGMRLFFTPDGDHVYGHWDMHETLPSQYWRYNFQNGIQYPSSAGLSAKYITTIKVYSSPESDWTLELDGRDIGGVNYTVSKPFLEEAIGCQFGADHKAVYTDGKGRVWEGMPLWFFAGFVDDADQHSANAYNETRARAGYNIVITGTDNFTTTISSKDIIRSSNYLLANSLNGTHIADSDENWPLRLTGPNVSGSMTVKGVKSVRLTRIMETPIADFIALPTSGEVPLPVQFTDNSTGTGPFTYTWDFNNDGIIDNTTPSPLYTYANAGTYSVNLTVANSMGSDSEVKIGYITINPAPIDEWSITLTGVGSEQLTRVNFEDLADGNRVIYNDGSSTWSGIALWRLLARVDDSDPAVFNDALADLGYTVNVTASDGFSAKFPSASLKRNDSWIVADTVNGTLLPKLDGKGKKLWPLKIVGSGTTSGNQRVANISYITLENFPAIPNANFTANPLSGPASLEVQFTDQSTGTAPFTYAWDFENDGAIDSTLQNPKFIYTTPGTYEVNLTVTNGVGSDSELRIGYITVNAPLVAPTAAFTSDIQSGTAPLTVKFTDQSTGTAPLTYAWDFDNDGLTDNTSQSPSYTYANAGTYTVNLTVTNSAGSDSEIKTGYITVQDDTDNDNILDTEEQGPGGTDPAYDGNSDGTPDSQQGNVASFHTTTDDYVTLVSVGGMYLSDVQAVDNPSPADTPAYLEMPFGFIDFALTGITPGGAVTVQLYVPEGTTVDTYYKYGKTPDNAISHWYEFLFDGTTGAEISGNIITLHFVDGKRGDNDTIANGIIIDPSGPGIDSRIPPTAAFSTDKVSGVAPLLVQFTDASTGTAPLSFAWDFENNGVIDSTLQNPPFTYTAPGTYTVNLTVINGAGSDSEIKTGYITVNAPLVAPTAAFTSDIQSGTAPLTVKFTDQSTGTKPCTYAWDFNNDGKTESTEQSPSYIYTIPGTYLVNLTVTNGAGCDSELKAGYIQVNAPQKTPTAAFTSDIQTGTAPLTVKFIDQSTGTTPLTYAWDFNNDGDTDSTASNPSYTYKKPGTYSVQLKVRNAYGRDTELKTGFIIVTVKPPVAIKPVADFSATPLKGKVPLKVKFTDLSTGTAPLTYAWDFNNDGYIDSNVKNPVYTYDKPGTYLASLTVTNVAGSATKQVTITVQPPMVKKPVAQFTQDKHVGNIPLTVHFTDESKNNPTSYLWRFGDGSTSTDKNPSHTYTKVGVYTVHFTATNSAGSDSTTGVVVVLPRWWWHR